MKISTLRSPIRLVANMTARMETSLALGSRLCRRPLRLEKLSDINASYKKVKIPSMVFPIKPFLP